MNDRSNVQAKDEILIKELLDNLSEVKAQLDMILIDKARKVQDLIPATIQQEIRDVDLEYEILIQSSKEKVEILETSIKAGVLGLGKSISGSQQMAVFNKGRITWDSQILKDLEVRIPELQDAKKIGENCVSFRGVK